MNPRADWLAEYNEQRLLVRRKDTHAVLAEQASAHPAGSRYWLPNLTPSEKRNGVLMSPESPQVAALGGGTVGVHTPLAVIACTPRRRNKLECNETILRGDIVMDEFLCVETW